MSDVLPEGRSVPRPRGGGRGGGQQAAVRHLGQHRQRGQQDGDHRGDGQDTGNGAGEGLRPQSAGILLRLPGQHPGEGQGGPPHLLDQQED